MRNASTLVSATRDSVRIELVRLDDPEHTTVLGVFTFQRVTADVAMLWTVDGRKALSVPDRLAFTFRCLRLTRKILL